MMKIMLTALLLFPYYFQCSSPNAVPALQATIQPTAQSAKTTRSKIQVALLLDTSNSMDGLIDQAKAQLWKMVNRLSEAKKNQQIAELEIALFEYGNSGLPNSSGYIRLVQALGSDLDGLSEKLFELRTNGGDEYCGWAIQSAQNLLSWSKDPEHLKIIVIAGNEPFNQGPVSFQKSCAQAVQNDIVINTIHCGSYDEGVAGFWKEGAELGNGKYLNIDTDEKVVHIATPYDSTILELNNRLNRTYIGYGMAGEAKKERQIAQDKNAAEYGAANQVQRATAKAKASYSNSDWDLVDASKSDSEFVKKVRNDELPAEWRGKKPEELEKEISKLSAERDAIREALAEQERLMQGYITEAAKKQTGSQTLDNVLIETVVEQAKAKGFSW